MPEKPSLYQDRLVKIRHQMQIAGVDGYIIPRTDEYQGEFLADYAQRVEWLTGFTGSAGVCAVLQNSAIVLSDGRYTIQLKNEVDLNLFEVANSIELSAEEWLCDHLKEGEKVGFDPWLHTIRQVEKMRSIFDEKGIELVAIEDNLIDLIWDDQPLRPAGKVILFPEDVAGKTFNEKIASVRDNMCAAQINAMVISAADSVCWLLNVRGCDVEYTPLVHSYVIVYANQAAEWFIDHNKVSDVVWQRFDGYLEIKPLDKFTSRLDLLKGQKVALDFGAVSQAIKEALSDECDVLDVKDPCVHARSIKSLQESKAIMAAHKADARALHQFMKWFETEVPKGNLCEVSVAEKLEECRSENPFYRGMSFPTICGFAENGAIIHYRADNKSNKKISGNGLLLLDSGGQYEWGTTDITRTIAVGKPTEEMRRHYTLVLKGHIVVSMAKFPKGTTGAQIDALARQALWRDGLDYAHGTGHGVGCYLGVHEAAANLSPRSVLAIEEGMLLSNEPGYYLEGHYGIRIENLILATAQGVCKETGKEMLGFETVTFAYYDERLIMRELLDQSEIAWLASYTKKVNVVLEQS